MAAASSLVVLASAAEAEAAGPSPYIIGAVALAILLTLLLVTLAFRNVGSRNRYRDGAGHRGSHASQEALAQYGSHYSHQNPEQHGR